MNNSFVRVNAQKIKSLSRSHLLVGITGHRDLFSDDYSLEKNSDRKLNKAFRETFLEIKQHYPNRPIVLLNCMADGSDILAAFVAAEMGIKTVTIASEQEIVGDAMAETFYAESAALIAGYSNILIAIWDGVDTGLKGGTSDIVQMIIEGKNVSGDKHTYYQNSKLIFDNAFIRKSNKEGIDPKGILYHILTRRQVNPYPVNRFENNTHLSGNDNITKTVFPLRPYYRNKIDDLWLNIKKYFWYNDLVWKFFMPIILALLTIILGTYGFRKLRLSNSFLSGLTEYRNFSGDDFFNAINLITFDSSVLEVEEIHWSLSFARVLGLITVILGFSIALIAALGNNFKTELALLWFKFLRLSGVKSKYNLVVGINTIGFNLAMDIRKKGEFVVVLDSTINDMFRAEALKNGIYLFKGSPYALTILNRLKAADADEIFITTPADTDNIRVLQELDQLCYSRKDKKSYKWFIHLQDQRLKQAIRNTDILTTHAEIVIVNIFENIARRLLIRYPVDQFDPNKSGQLTEVIVFGNSEVATQIVMQCIRQAQYNNENRLRVVWFVENKESFGNNFYKKYPCLSFEENTIFGNGYAKEIRDHIFPADIIQFKEIPASDTAYFDDRIIYNAVKSVSIVRLYFCIEDSILSAAYMNAIARRIKTDIFVEDKPVTANVQLFCFYNISDKEEVKHVELMSNKNLPYMPIIFFGNFLDECTWRAFAEKSLDKLPMLINFWYSIRREPGKWQDEHVLNVMKQAEQKWKVIGENAKESSRLAADHLWIKLRMLNISPDQLQSNIFTANNPDFKHQIAELAMIEHYRWCRERILEGYIPIQDIEERAVTEPGWYIENWQDAKFKSFYQDQKLHIDLILFDKLFSGYYNGRYYDEKNKDISFIEAFPFFLKWIKK